ncbi:MAG: DnaJ domain-containing protein [Rhizobiaceae bacterium]|nr:DnaJ domain-containing protein [Rhizobiaceae bacterium]
MSPVAGLLLGLLLVGALIVVFTRMDAARLATSLRLAGPGLLGVAGFVLLVLGRAALGGMLLSTAAGWYGLARGKKRISKPAGQRSTVRTAALEMELDHDTGGLEGMILAGTYEQRVLSTLSLSELTEAYRELASDSESRQLLETYLDGRFPAWRDDLKTDGGNRHGVPPGAGTMTKEEAYKILGLETGASTTDIRKAHRRLMQRLHPDLGGTSFLAARINEAKDVLLSDHS